MKLFDLPLFKASQNCRRAKEELEHMCLNLSEELSLFDIRKEQELKQIFIEYAQSRCDIFEKVRVTFESCFAL